MRRELFVTNNPWGKATTLGFDTHEKRTEEYKWNEISVGEVRPARFRPFVGTNITRPIFDAGQHDGRPGFTGGTPVELQVER